MSRSARIKKFKEHMVCSDKQARDAAAAGHAAAASYYGSHLSYYQTLINEIKLDDISDRLELIETALGLMAAKKVG